VGEGSEACEEVSDTVGIEVEGLPTTEAVDGTVKDGAGLGYGGPF
jgi:hypothetical protein